MHRFKSAILAIFQDRGIIIIIHVFPISHPVKYNSSLVQKIHVLDAEILCTSELCTN